MHFIFRKQFLLIFPLLVAALIASPILHSATPSDGMRHFSEMEEFLLQQRRALLDRENAVQSPMWIIDEQGMYQIIDGAELRTRAEGLSSIAELMIAEGMSIDGSYFANRIIAQMIAKQVEGADPAGKILDGYAKYSAKNRAAALRSLDSMLEYAREQFALEMAERDSELLSGTHPCQQLQSLDARRFFFRHYGNSGWRLFVKNGGFYCAAPRAKPRFGDSKYYAYVTISGKYLAYTECPKGVCTTSPNIWKAIRVNEGDRHLEGAVYKDKAQEATAGYLATFNWWQCSPALPGSNSSNTCINDLVVE